jgi:hypothetical protein
VYLTDIVSERAEEVREAVVGKKANSSVFVIEGRENRFERLLSSFSNCSRAIFLPANAMHDVQREDP